MNPEKSQEIDRILNVKIDSTPLPKVLANIQNVKSIGRPVTIVTPNPEIILQSQRDRDLMRIINESDISLPDGIGIALAKSFLRQKYNGPIIFKLPYLFFSGIFIGLKLLLNPKAFVKRENIIKGREFFLELLNTANEKKWSVFLLGGKPGVSEMAISNLSKKYKSVRFFTAPAAEYGNSLSVKGKLSQQLHKNSILAIKKNKPDIVFVGLGAPKQEKWIDKFGKYLNAKVIMAVGGTFDFYSDINNLARRGMVAYEWFWRLIRDPRRLGRIYNAVVVFPYKVFISKLKN